MRIGFLNLRNFTYFLLLLMFFNSCKYTNHQINEYPSMKWDENKKINIALVLSGAGSGTQDIKIVKLLFCNKG